MAQYYISTSGSDNNNGTSTGTPWKTLAKVSTMANNGTIHAGDTLSFKRGDTFIAPNSDYGMVWWSIFGGSAPSGTSNAPITFNAYGTGAKPNFIFTPNSGVDKERRRVMTFYGVSYINFDSLSFHDTNFNISDKTNPCYTSEGLDIGADGFADSNHCIVTNCDFNNIGNGLTVYGTYNTIGDTDFSRFSNTFVDLKNIVNTVGGNGEDYGANGITLGGSNNTIVNNFFKGCWAQSHDFGYNGGAVEIYGASSNNKMIANTIQDCGGVAEFGSGNGGSATNNTFAYNNIINCGMLTYCNIGGQFALNVTNTQYYNNIIIENNNSRFSGPNAGLGAVPADYEGAETALFKYGGSATGTVFVLKNNIFQLSTGINITDSFSASKVTHSNNLYKLSNGSSTQYTIGGTEKTTSAAIFTSTANSNESLWDFTPLVGSPQLNMGVDVGFTVDSKGTAIIGLPDAGTIERAAVGSTLTISLVQTPFPCNDNVTTVNVIASGGTPPYTGTGYSTALLGAYTYTIHDSLGASATASITVVRQFPILYATLTASPGGTLPYNGTTSLISTVTGGVPPYTYSLDGKSYQSSNVFRGVIAGGHGVGVKDSNGCNLMTSILLSQHSPGPTPPFFKMATNTLIKIYSTIAGTYIIKNSNGVRVLKGRYAANPNTSEFTNINISTLGYGRYTLTANGTVYNFSKV